MASPLRGPLGARSQRKPYPLLVALTIACAFSANAATDSSTPESVAATAASASPANISTTLASAWDKALSANPGLRAAQFGAAATEGAILQAKARPNPELSFTQEDTRSSTRTSTVQINQVIELGGKREARVRVAESEKAAANATVFETQAALRHQLVSYFNELLLAQQRVLFASKTHELATQAFDAAQKRVQAGKVAPLEASRAQVAQANAALELEQAKLSIVVAQQHLASLWGGRASEVGEAKGDFSSTAKVPTADQLETLIEESPAIVLARHMLDQSRATSELERAKRVQDPTVSVGVKRAEEAGRNQLLLGVSIPLPILDSNRGNQLQALRLADKAEDELQAARQLAQAQLLQNYEQLQTSRAQTLQLQSKVLPGALSAYEVAAKGFSLGKFSYLDVLDAQRTLADARSLYLDQLVATHRAAADITRQLGDIPGLE